MKKIKKVEVIPIDRNIGKIVDSTGTVDDKTKNTYSMRIIEQMAKDLTSETYSIKARGMTSQGTIDTTNSVNGIVMFKKRNGVVMARFLIPPVQTYGSILLYDTNFVPFSIPNNYKAVSNWYPKKLSYYNNSDLTKIAETHIAEGQITLNDQVIFEGVYVDFIDNTGGATNGQLYFSDTLIYMAQDI